MRELGGLDLPRSPGREVNVAPVTEADLDPLPETARRYLRFMRVVGRPRDWSFRMGFTGRFRRPAMAPGWIAKPGNTTRASLSRASSRSASALSAS